MQKNKIKQEKNQENEWKYKVACKFEKDSFFSSKKVGLTENGLHDYNLKDAPKTDALLLRTSGKKDSCFSFAFLAKAKLVEMEFF